MNKILNCISQIEEFNVEQYNDLQIGVEIQDFTEPNLSNKDMISLMDRYRKQFKNFSGLKSMHGPFLDLKPASPDPLIREVSYKRYLDTLHIASQLDMDYVIFHSQINPYLNHPDLIDLNNRQMAEFWDKILKEVKHFKGTIVIENIFEGNPSMIKKSIEAINKTNIKINLDIGHAKLGDVSLETWISELKDHIAYMHIHSNDSNYDLHQGLDKKEIKDLYKVLSKYDLNVPLALEYKVSDLESELNKYKINA